MNGVGTGAARASATARATERDCWIALSLVPGVGPATFAQLLRAHGSAIDAWRAGAAGLRRLARVADEAVAGFARIEAADPRALARAMVERTARTGGRVVTALDSTYPAALLNLDPRPPTLYVIGEQRAFEERAVAVVGTRGATGYGLSVATEIGQSLAEAGVVVVSGLALGIDGAAHRAAVAVGGRSVAVLPSPIDRIHPPRHRPLARSILDRGGALISEVPTGAVVGRPDFARRNRIIAGLATAVVVVEAPDRSGALLTAAAAVAIGRDLYAVPGPISAMASRGCNRLVADKVADLVTSVPALAHRIGAAGGEAPPAASALSEVEGLLVHRLLERSGSLEELVDRTGQPPAAVASALTLLEARGLVDAFGGATFHPTLAARRLGNIV